MNLAPIDLYIIGTITGIMIGFCILDLFLQIRHHLRIKAYQRALDEFIKKQQNDIDELTRKIHERKQTNEKT